MIYSAVRFLITYLRDHGADPLLLDLDDENRTLSRFFTGALKVEIKKKSSHDILVERALKGDSLIIADLKAGTGREVLDWWLDVPFEELQFQGVGFICLASVTSSPDSVQSFLNWVTALEDRVRYVVFRNHKDGDYLPDYDKSDGALSFRETFRPHHVVIPRLDQEYVTELERLDLTIAEVLDSSNGISARGRNIGPGSRGPCGPSSAPKPGNRPTSERSDGNSAAGNRPARVGRMLTAGGLAHLDYLSATRERAKN